MSLMNYISKYPYTDLSALNIDYWIKLVAEAAADIKKLYADDDAIRAEMAAFEAEIRAYILTLPSQIQAEVTSYLDSNLESLLEDSPALLKVNKDWSKRTVLFVGDSYLDGWNGSESVKTYADYMNDFMGFKAYYKASMGGAGFGYDLSAHYKSNLESWYGAHTSDAATITDIFIMGGYNDYGKTADDIINNATYGLKATVNYAKTNFPNAKIRIGMIGRALYSANMSFTNFNKVVNAYRTGARDCGVEYLEGSELCLHDYTNFSTDKIHPSTHGYEVLGHLLASLVLSGNFSFLEYNTSPVHHINIDQSLTAFESFPINFYQTLRDDCVQIELYGGAANLSSIISSVTCDYQSAHYIKIGDFKNVETNNYFMPEQDIMVPVPLTVYADGSVVEVQGNVIFSSDGCCYLSLFKLTDNAWGFAELTDVTKIAIGCASISIPIRMC